MTSVLIGACTGPWRGFCSSLSPAVKVPTDKVLVCSSEEKRKIALGTLGVAKLCMGQLLTECGFPTQHPHLLTGV